MIDLTVVSRTDSDLLHHMKNHYSKPKGFVGRNVCYAISYGSQSYGFIVGGSATLHLPGRHEFLGTKPSLLNNIVNNIFYSVSHPPLDKYPIRNFSSEVVKVFVEQLRDDWESKYGDVVLGFETLVEQPRTGETYRRAGWTRVGETLGYTCKRQGGEGTDSWSGQRVWDTENLRPKNVFCLKVE